MGVQLKSKEVMIPAVIIVVALVIFSMMWAPAYLLAVAVIVIIMLEMLLGVFSDLAKGAPLWHSFINAFIIILVVVFFLATVFFPRLAFDILEWVLYLA